jgi:hypothetical protein
MRHVRRNSELRFRRRRASFPGRGAPGEAIGARPALTAGESPQPSGPKMEITPRRSRSRLAVLIAASGGSAARSQLRFGCDCGGELWTEFCKR